MATASISETINAPIDTIFKVITEYESYPEFLPETKSAKIVGDDGNEKLVKFEIDVIKRVKYTLRIKEVHNKSMQWELEEGDLFRKNCGKWKLEGNGDSTKVTYFLEVEFKLLVPSLITKKLVGANIPAMIKSFKNRAEALVSKGK